MNKRVNAYFSGMVQGVGFRYTAERLANKFYLTGWVRNLNDGRVEITAEGNEIHLKEFLARINKEMEQYINDIDIGWQTATGEFTGFKIAF